LSWRLPGCPPRFCPLCPPRPRRRPPCRLLIKCLRPYAVVLTPWPSGYRVGVAGSWPSRSGLCAHSA